MLPTRTREGKQVPKLSGCEAIVPPGVQREGMARGLDKGACGIGRGGGWEGVVVVVPVLQGVGLGVGPHVGVEPLQHGQTGETVLHVTVRHLR